MRTQSEWNDRNQKAFHRSDDYQKERKVFKLTERSLLPSRKKAKIFFNKKIYLFIFATFGNRHSVAV